MSNKNTACVGLCTLVSAGFFLLERVKNQPGDSNLVLSLNMTNYLPTEELSTRNAVSPGLSMTAELLVFNAVKGAAIMPTLNIHNLRFE